MNAIRDCLTQLERSIARIVKHPQFNSRWPEFIRILADTQDLVKIMELKMEGVCSQQTPDEDGYTDGNAYES